MKELKKLVEHLERRFEKNGKNFLSEIYETCKIVKKVKNEISCAVSNFLKCDTEADLIFSISPFRDDDDLISLASITARSRSNLTPENFEYAEPYYCICVNPLALTTYAEEAFPIPKEKCIKAVLAEEFAHIGIEKKYKMEKLKLEIFVNKRFKGKKVPLWYVIDYLYILGGKEEACAMYVANQIVGFKFYTPDNILENISQIEIREEDYFKIGGKLTTCFEKAFAAYLLRRIKNQKDFENFLLGIDNVTKEEIKLLEKSLLLADYFRLKE
ncbi:MAG: hypothetical protein QXX07_03045 [Candidatus Aenigmatarchaeota archaeon]